jgi:DNA-binding PadR family transcriptional regulator
MDLDKLTERVLDRMVRAGWLKGYARDAKGLVIEWTPKGKDAAIQFRGLFDQLGDEMSAPELAVLLNTIDNMSPGGTADATGKPV